MIKNYVIIAALAFVACFAWGTFQHSEGWKSGRVALGQEYTNRAQAQQAKATSGVQKGEVKAAAAKESSDKQFEVIEREVIKYITRPSPDKCMFDDVRVRTKRAALDAAGNIPGLDDAPGQTTTK